MLFVSLCRFSVQGRNYVLDKYCIKGGGLRFALAWRPLMHNILTLQRKNVMREEELFKYRSY